MVKCLYEVLGQGMEIDIFNRRPDRGLAILVSSAPGLTLTSQISGLIGDTPEGVPFPKSEQNKRGINHQKEGRE
jgi:hypothetical protein